MLSFKDFGHMFLPLLVSHTIDESSPLYDIAPADMMNSR